LITLELIIHDHRITYILSEKDKSMITNVHNHDGLFQLNKEWKLFNEREIERDRERDRERD
jgi:hypothetical protein